jgi:pimeloyl-ACP methyl ester carboxylesterase
MTEPELHFVACPDAQGGHRMAYWQWGDPSADHVVVCVHGLSRQGRDFDVLARALCARAPTPLRVVCPDVVGRGRSDWLQDPSLYQIPAYAGDMLALLAQLKPAVLDWVGTSMGGLIGMVVCGQPGLPLPVPVRRLVLNDVGRPSAGRPSNASRPTWATPAALNHSRLPPQRCGPSRPPSARTPMPNGWSCRARWSARWKVRAVH